MFSNHSILDHVSAFILEDPVEPFPGMYIVAPLNTTAGGTLTLSGVGIGAGETTADGKVSLLVARCLGSCGLAPAGVFDGEVTGKLSPENVLEKIGRWRTDDPQH